MRLLTILLVSGLSIPVFAQKEEKSKHINGLQRHSISLNGAGTSALAGVSWEYFLSPRWQTDIGIGYPGGGVGIHFYPWPVKKGVIRPEIGASYGLWLFPKNQYHAAYAGIGASWFLKKRISFLLDLGPGYYPKLDPSKPKPDQLWFLMGNFKLCFRLGKSLN